MVLLQNLPTELLCRILDLLPEYEGDALHTKTRNRDSHGALLPLRIRKKALLNLCLVSHRFRSLAQPVLFRYFQWDDLGADLYDEEDEFRALLQFAKAIFQRPQLGEYVQFMSIDTLLDETPISFLSFDGAAQKYLTDAIKKLDLSNKAKKLWTGAPARCDLPIILAMVIKMAPNLRGLRFPDGYHILERINTVWRSEPSLLSALQCLWISADEEEFYWYQISRYEKLLCLPHVNSSTFEYGTLTGSSFPSTWTPGSLGVEEIAFAHCHIDATAIRKFLSACRKVRAVTFQNFSFVDQDVRPKSKGRAQFNAADLHAAVLPHKETLEHFHLEFFRDPSILGSIEAYENFCRSHAKIPSFADFPVLDTIFIQHALLPEHPIFSPALELLKITDCNSSIRDMVGFIAADVKAGQYPRLKKFTIITVDITRPVKLPGQRIPVNQTPEQCFLSLEALFKGTGVNFMIAPYEMPPDIYGGSDDDYDDLDGIMGDDFGYDLDAPYGYQFPPTNGMPAGLMMMMQQAMQNPALAEESDRSWETEDEV
ncbi:hypothetical protein BJX64DRAFT_259632 [Aspergillus heterothallicus]